MSNLEPVADKKILDCLNKIFRKEMAGICGLFGKGAQALKLYVGLELTADDRERLVGFHAAAKDFVAAEKGARELLATRPEDARLKRLLADVLS